MSAPDETSYLKTAFLLRVAHELRGPAGVIQGSLSELSAALGDDAQRFQRFFAMAERGVARVVRTAALLEQTGQLAAGEVELERTPCDLRDLARIATSRAESIEGRRRITVTLELPEKKVIAEVDPEWMMVALAEIASNAIRHAREKVVVRLEASPSEARAMFADDGAPFASFEPIRFQPPPERRGHGLALSVARDVILAHGGELVIERAGGGESGGETRVGVVLPIEDRRGRSAEARAARVSS